MSISYQLRIFSYYLHCLLQEAVNNTVFFAFPDDSSLTFAYLRADQESLTVYTSKPSQWTRDSVCRDSDAGYFASRSGVAGVAEEDVSTSEDEAGDNPPGDQVDPPGDQVDPPDDETDPTTDTDTEEQLLKSTACKDGKGTSDDDTASPDNLLTEATVRPDEKPHTEREPLTDPLSKQPSAFEAERHFLAPDQASPADIGPDSQEQEEVSCSGKVESTEVVNEEQVETNGKKKAKHMFDGKKQAESAGSAETGNEDKTKEANSKTGASEPKRTSNAVLGQSKAVAVGATALKQGTCEGRLEREQLSASSQETDSKKGGAKVESTEDGETEVVNGSTETGNEDKTKEANSRTDASKKGGAKEASPPVADEQPDPKTRPSKDNPCCKSVGTTDAKEPTVSHGQGVEDTQDVVAVEDECAQVTVEGQQVQMVVVHMEPNDYHRPPPPHPRGERHLRAVPFPIQESEQGREKPAQLALPHT